VSVRMSVTAPVDGIRRMISASSLRGVPPTYRRSNSARTARSAGTGPGKDEHEDGGEEGERFLEVTLSGTSRMEHTA
jgi:hypothetical protein